MGEAADGAGAAPDLADPALYINRELSWLEFNRRVLALASDPEVPLLERLRFLCICSGNLDEFFEIRVAGLKQQAAHDAVQPGPDGLTPQEQLARIAERAHALVDEQYRVLNESLLPALAAEGIRFLRRDQWNPRQAAWIRRHFLRQVLPVLTPIGLDPAHPFPRVLNKGLHFIVSVEGEDAFGRRAGIAVVQAPRSLPRLIQLPAGVAEAPYDFVFLSSVIHAHVDELFPGMEVTGCYQFRVTRNSELFVDEEEVDNLLRALAGELPSRQYGDAVRLEVADNCPPAMARFLLRQFALGPDDLYRVNGPVNLNRLVTLPDLVDRPDLKYPPFTPGVPEALAGDGDPFEAIRRGDILLHHPYESFAPVQELVRRAAADPDVLAIKQTLYRTGEDSAIVEALLEAARAGKEVAVVVELRARFDEEANIDLATRLQEAGAHVVYGVVGYKTHAKMLLIVRREGRAVRRYAHLGTGNYHARTARAYTDFGLLTADPAVTDDVQRIFQQLTGLGRAVRLRKLLQAPFTLHGAILGHIRREAEHARAGRPARIVAKMNALVEPQVIRALYEASQAGVEIDLIVRGICCLRPGVAGVSERIRVRSVLGRFLEHHRVFYFENGGDPALYLSSADWMDRNFFRRVETCFPVEDEALRRRVWEEGLAVYLRDNTQAWELLPDGSYRRLRPGRQRPRAAQVLLLERLARPTPRSQGSRARRVVRGA
ncbi:polyphosphate kinase 1 [Inmirania thermothiophila]|uniref:Polyphosphate kinase n=1 Tax=Inmirania thermothiophila TaxID=1750597 RepID=A0A3N1Y679_9GAMM|nr:polyphosphate kinase 1 [Inmirania thermothiophila]ROR34260.1 polyphosphate kinase [Inmirania thermothiophila]